MPVSYLVQEKVVCAVLEEWPRLLDVEALVAVEDVGAEAAAAGPEHMTYICRRSATVLNNTMFAILIPSNDPDEVSVVVVVDVVVSAAAFLLLVVARVRRVVVVVVQGSLLHVVVG